MLINKVRHAFAMSALIVIGLLVVCLLAPLLGVDSATREEHDRRGLPAASRRAL